MADYEDVGGTETANQSIFNNYICRTLSWGSSHPGDIAEATSLSSVGLPPAVATYPLRESLPPDLLARGGLSSLQAEGVCAAATKHCEILPSGSRAGFFIGDGAGVGKGRQIAALILDSIARGRPRHAWCSISTDLAQDAARDLRDLGAAGVNLINNVQTLDRETRALGLSSDYQQGVLFLTYATLISTVRGKSRLQQVIDWLGGPSFDGCIVFDECHKAKNFVAGKEGGGGKEGGKEGGEGGSSGGPGSTKVALAVLELQRRLPMARILYCSATGVSEVGHMAYLERMGLWGPGTSFHGFDAFLAAMKRRGVSFMEMLAMEMKAEGRYVARGLSFRDAEFSELEAVLTPEQANMYDAAAHVWGCLRGALSDALALCGVPGRDVWRVFWSAQQRFFKLLCVSLKVPTVVAEARGALAAGQCVVIGLQTTGEAADMAAGVEPGAAVPGFVSTTKEMLVRFMRDHFPVHAAPPATTAAAAVGNAPPPRVVPEAVALRDGLVAAAAALSLPPNFLDELIHEFGGPGQVAEMTGRHARVVGVPDSRSASGVSGTRFVYELRARSEGGPEMESLNVRERDAFMSGAKRVAIISDAASTGISLHADARAANQRRRVHLTIELPWSADKAIQQLGRSHRSNQVTGPIYKLVSTRVGGEKRFAAAVARRLQSLGALTRGDRRAASGIDLSEQNYDSPLGRRALRRMYDAIVTEAPTLPTGVSLAAIRREGIKDELGRPDMDDAEADALAGLDDSALANKAVAAMHAQLREYVDLLGVTGGSGTSGTRGLAVGRDTVAEDTEAARARGGMASSAATATKGTSGAKDVGDVRKFLNRLLGLPLSVQNTLFAYFAACLDAEVDAARREGKYSEGLADLSGARITPGPSAVLWVDPLTGLRTTRHDFTVDRGLSFTDACASLVREGGGGGDDGASGFRRSRRPLYGAYMVLLALRKPGTRNMFAVRRPNTGHTLFDLERSELDAKYVRITPEQAEAEWTAAYDSSLTRCIHGAECKQGPSCATGRRLAAVTVLGGSVVRVWGVLEAVLARHEHELSKADRTMRVVRVELAEGCVVSPSTSPTAPAKAHHAHGSNAACGGAPKSEDDELEIVSEIVSEDGAGVAVPEGHTGTGAAAASEQAPSASNGPSAAGAGGGAGGGPRPPSHLVGVRYPAVLLPEVQAMLQSLMLRQVEGGAASAATMGRAGSRGGAAEEGVEVPEWVGGSSVRVEPVAPVDKRAMAKAYRAPKTMHDFFRPKAAAGDAGGLLDEAGTATQAVSGATQRTPLGGQAGKGGSASNGRGLPAAANFFKPRGGSSSQAVQAVQMVQQGRHGMTQRVTAGDVELIELCSDGEAEEEEEGRAGGMQTDAQTPGDTDTAGAGVAAGEARGVLRPRDNDSVGAAATAASDGCAKRPKVKEAPGGLLTRVNSAQPEAMRAGSGTPRQPGNGSTGDMKAMLTCSAPGGGADGSKQSEGGSKAAGLGDLVAMGFSAAQAERALFLAKGDVERAADLILGGM